MNMLTAIAYSAGNKARAINNYGSIVVVQQQFFPKESETPVEFHLWLVVAGKVDQRGQVPFDPQHIANLPTLYAVDPEANYWQSI